MDRRVAVAHIIRPKGVRGEVKARLLTWDPRRLDDLERIVVQRDGNADLALRLERWRQEGDGVVLKFAGIDSPEVAKSRLTGGYVTVSPEEVPPPPPDTYYVDDLVGCVVVDTCGRSLGRLVEVMDMPSTDVFRVQGARGEILVPAVGDFVVDVRVQEKRIVIRGMDELLEAG